MPLSPEQIQKLKDYAAKNGLDEKQLIAAGEKQQSNNVDGQEGRQGQAPSRNPGTDGTTEKPELYMYLLPFVTVKEVRQNWLELTDSFPGDSEVAADWAAKHGGGGGSNGSAPPEGGAQ